VILLDETFELLMYSPFLLFVSTFISIHSRCSIFLFITLFLGLLLIIELHLFNTPINLVQFLLKGIFIPLYMLDFLFLQHCLEMLLVYWASTLNVNVVITDLLSYGFLLLYHGLMNLPQYISNLLIMQFAIHQVFKIAMFVSRICVIAPLLLEYL
jgi:hypothetical protein